jgi:hypothetical protein
MRKELCLLLLLITSVTAFSQNRFPGLSGSQKQKLLSTKTPVPLPTWLPAGFGVTNIITKTGKQVKIEDKVLTITYGKKLANGRLLKFKIDAGFDGLGDLPYQGGEAVKSKIGNIWWYYEPIEETDEGRKVKYVGFIQTEWFEVKGLAFHVSFIQSDDDDQNTRLPKISKGDAKKILQSLEVLK